MKSSHNLSHYHKDFTFGRKNLQRRIFILRQVCEFYRVFYSYNKPRKSIVKIWNLLVIKLSILTACKYRTSVLYPVFLQCSFTSTQKDQMRPTANDLSYIRTGPYLFITLLIYTRRKNQY